MKLIKFRDGKQDFVAIYIRTEAAPGHKLEGQILINENIHRDASKWTARWVNPDNVHVWWIKNFRSIE